MSDDAPSDYMGGDGAHEYNNDQKQHEAESRAQSGSNIPREVLDDIVESVK
jgi:hypothetical protein